MKRLLGLFVGVLALEEFASLLALGYHRLRPHLSYLRDGAV
jgi:hypothetical protein